jgi:hypothetical protein
MTACERQARGILPNILRVHRFNIDLAIDMLKEVNHREVDRRGMRRTVFCAAGRLHYATHTSDFVKSSSSALQTSRSLSQGSMPS